MADRQTPDAWDHIYVHVPFCDGKCLYCAFYSERYTSSLCQAWMESLAREIDLRLSERADRSAPAPITLYLGGGTPGLLAPPQLEQLCTLLRERFCTDRLREWTVETNPNTLTAEKLRILRQAGVHRVSVGAQSFDDATLRRIGRRHQAADIRQAFALLHDSGFRNAGLDLIAGLPGLDRAAWEQGLREAIALDPTHLSVYALSVEKGSRMEEQVTAGRLHLPDEDQVLDALDQAETLLAAAGFERYEISNFARPGFRCEHNLSCWRGEDYLGFGPAASSRIGCLRRTLRPDLAGYTAALRSRSPAPAEEETLDPAMDAAERLMFAFRLLDGVDLAEHIRRLPATQRGLAQHWQQALQRLAGDGLVSHIGSVWKLTVHGRKFADSVAEELLP